MGQRRIERRPGIPIYRQNPLPLYCPRGNIPRNKYISRLFGSTLISFKPTRFEWRTDTYAPGSSSSPAFPVLLRACVIQAVSFESRGNCVKSGIKCGAATVPNSLFFPRSYIIGTLFVRYPIIAAYNIIAHSA